MSCNRLNFVHVYVNDCLTVCPDRISHLPNLNLVFERLQKHGVAVNIQKCEIVTDSPDFFGYIIDSQVIRPLRSKVETILDNL